MNISMSRSASNTRRGAAGVVALLVCIAASCSSDSPGKAASPTSPAPAASATTQPGGAVVSATDAAQTPVVQPVAVPAKWPAELALPSSVTPTQVVDEPNQMDVAGVISGDVQAVFDTLKQQLTAAGYEIVGSVFTPTDKGGYGSISAKGTAYTAAIAFGPDPTGATNTVDIAVAPVGG